MAVFEPTLQGYLPQSLTRRIKAAYEIICPLQQNIDNNNPVEQRLIVVNGSEAQVYIDEVGADVEAAVDNSVAAGGTTKTATTGEGRGGQQARAAGHSRNEILGLYSQQRETQHAWYDTVTGTSGIQPGYSYEGDKKDANYSFKNVTDAITKISSR